MAKKTERITFAKAEHPRAVPAKVEALKLTEAEKADKLKSLASDIAAKDFLLEAEGARLGILSNKLNKLITADGFFVNKQSDSLALVDQINKVKENIARIVEEKQPFLKEQKQLTLAEIKKEN